MRTADDYRRLFYVERPIVATNALIDDTVMGVYYDVYYKHVDPDTGEPEWAGVIHRDKLAAVLFAGWAAYRRDPHASADDEPRAWLPEGGRP